MGAKLPELNRDVFADQLRAGSAADLGGATIDALFAHYELLRRWNRRLSLVGPGTADEMVTRHYGEALAALPLLDTQQPDDLFLADSQSTGSTRARARSLVDVGSGAGFPGFVLAVASPELNVVLTEARSRKWSFLRSAIRAATECMRTATDSAQIDRLAHDLVDAPPATVSAPSRAAPSRAAPSPVASLSCSSLNARIARPLPRELPAVIDVVTCRAVRLDHEWLEALIEHSPAARFLLWQGVDHELPSLLREVRAVHIGDGSSRRIVEAVAKEIG